MPIGDNGLAMVDARDLGEIAAIELVHREEASEPLHLERINVVGPDTLTGANVVAAIWSDVLGPTIHYGGNDTAGSSRAFRIIHQAGWRWTCVSWPSASWSMAWSPGAGDVDRLTAMLGRPLRSYRDFATKIAVSA
jgi:hypothetical protein